MQWCPTLRGSGTKRLVSFSFPKHTVSRYWLIVSTTFLWSGLTMTTSFSKTM